MAPQRKQYAQGEMEKAVEAVRGGMSVKSAAQRFGVPRSTLSDKVHDKYPVTPKPRTILTTEEEGKLEEWLTVSARRGVGRTKEDLCLVVQRILNREGRTTIFKDNLPRKCWVRSFFERHPKLRQKKAMVLGDQRARVTEGKIKAWFEEVERNLSDDGVDIRTIDPRCVFNADETGFPLHSSGHVIVTDEGNRHPYLIGSDNKRQITVLSCASASGHLLPPTIIFPGQRWTFKPWEDFPEAACVQTANGWINTTVFQTWLEQSFIPAVAGLPRPIVLFCDGHTSHTSLEVHDLCKEHGIIYYLLPAHASHLVQPLDLIFYGILKEEWRKALHDHRSIARVGGIFPRTFVPVFKDVWTRAYGEGREGVLVKAFRKSGLSPWDPNAPDYSKCEASRVYEKPATPASCSTGPHVTAVSTCCDVPFVCYNYDDVPLSVACKDDDVPPPIECKDDDVPPSIEFNDNNDVVPSILCDVDDDVHTFISCVADDVPTANVHCDVSPSLVCCDVPPSLVCCDVPTTTVSTCCDVVVPAPTVPFPCKELAGPPPTALVPNGEWPDISSGLDISATGLEFSGIECISEDFLDPVAEFQLPLVSTPARDPVGDQDHDYCLPEQALRPLEDETLVTPQAPQKLPQDNAFVLDQLIDHVIATGWTASDMYWVRRRQWHNIDPKADEGAYRKYLEFYNKLIPAPSFDNLPVPAGWNSKVSTQKRAQAPKYVSGVRFKEWEEAKKLEEEKKKEELEKRKRERERKRVEKEEEKKKKEEEKRLKKLENQRAGKKRPEGKKTKKCEEDENLAKKDGEKEAEGSESGNKGRKRKVQAKMVKQKKRKGESDEETEEEDEKEVGLVYADDSSVDESLLRDPNACYTCGGRGEKDGWVGCDVCELWYHKGCCGRQSAVLCEMSKRELEDFTFVCPECE